MENVFLDMMGGLLSLIVVLIKYFNSGSSSDFQDVKLAKFLLSLVVLVFDSILLWQHFMVFNINRKINTKAEKKMLINQKEEFLE